MIRLKLSVTTSEIINLQGDGANVSYLTWQQSPEMARLEQLKGTGNALSGRAFKFMFMGIHLEVSNHAEIVEAFLQRRVNFLVSAIGSITPKLKKTADLIMIETEIQLVEGLQVCKRVLFWLELPTK